MENIENQGNIKNKNHIFCIIRKTEHKNGDTYTAAEKISKISSLIGKDTNLINAQDQNDNGNTLLHVASLNKDKELIEKLLKCESINCNITNNNGKNPKDLLKGAALESLLPPYAVIAQLSGTASKKRKINESATGTHESEPQIQEEEKSKVLTKGYIHKFILDLFGIPVSNQVLVDITIFDNLNDNHVTIVGRPQVLGSSIKQMRHITPYSFIKNAITSKVTPTKEKPIKLPNVIPEFIQHILPLLLPIKEGICLLEEDFTKYIKNKENDILTKDKKGNLTSLDLYETKLTTSSAENTNNVWYLIKNNQVIEHCKTNQDFNEEKLKEAQNNYNSKWLKYIKFGMQYINEEIQTNELAVIDSAELVSRLILTIFNQTRDACFAEEGNTLPEEIRKYNSADDAKKYSTKYTSYSHAQICAQYNELQKDRGALIRIVDNEGSIVKRTANALNLLNCILNATEQKYDLQGILEYIDKYNKNYNLQHIGSLPNKDLQNYIQELDINNYKQIYDVHIAKHLYSVFDFKPLEKDVLAPAKRDANKVQINVYPSATGTTIACYSKQEGDVYREQCYNSRSKGYNEHTLFRNLLTDNQTKDLLIEKITSHFFISLIPFGSLIVPYEDKEENKKSLTRVFKAFYKLVQEEYAVASSIKLNDPTNLDSTSPNATPNKWSKIIDSIFSENLDQSNISSNIDTAEISVSGTTIPEIQDFF